MKFNQKEVNLFLEENPQFKKRVRRPEAISQLTGVSIGDVKQIISLDRTFRLLTIPDAKSQELAEQAKEELGYDRGQVSFVPEKPKTAVHEFYLNNMANDTFLK